MKKGILLGLLAIFGYWYNGVVEGLEKQNKEKGYLAILVGVGSAVTIIGVSPLIGWVNTLWVLAGFVASGLPMTWGSIRRYMEARYLQEQARRMEEEQIRFMVTQEADNNDAQKNEWTGVRRTAGGTGSEGRKCVRFDGDR